MFLPDLVLVSLYESTLRKPSEAHQATTNICLATSLDDSRPAGDNFLGRNGVMVPPGPQTISDINVDKQEVEN